MANIFNNGFGQNSNFFGNGFWNSFGNNQGVSNGASGAGGNFGGNLGWLQVAQLGANATTEAIGVPMGKYKRGAYDFLDPWYHASGKNRTGVGEAFSNAGVSMFKDGVKNGNLFEMAAGGITKGTGSMINAFLGTNVDQAKLQAAKNDINYLKNFNSYADDYDDIVGIRATQLVDDPYSSGIFRPGWAKRRNNFLRQEYDEAYSQANRALKNNMDNIFSDKINSGLRGWYSQGGFLGYPPSYMYQTPTVSGALDYNIASDYLTMKKAQADNKYKFGALPSFSTSVFANGGKIHIKHPGRLTALKKRTGKTEAELYNDGNPAHKKMVVFARSARRWNKHAEGGYLEGKVYDVSKDEARRLISLGYEIECL